MKKQMLNKKGNGGITLIALVITIIVLLILAGVSIATLTGENGILTQAQNAKTETEKAEAKERIQLEVLASYGTEGKINIATLKSNLATNVPEATIGEETELPLTVTLGDYTFKVNTNGTVEEVTSGGVTPPVEKPDTPTPPVEGTVAVVGEKVTGSENKIYTKNGTAVIPVGFAIVPGLDDVSEGLVISDVANDTTDSGNQFVWVPVSKENFATEFVREHFGTEDQKWWTGTFVTDGLSADNMYEPVADGINVDTTASSSVQEVQKMYKSVRDNGGFYIGRYEAGVEGVENVTGSGSSSSSGSVTGSGSGSGSGTGIRGTAVSKKGANVYNYIGWSNSTTMTVETGGAVEVAREFAGVHNYETVTSTLVYGVQWDAVMRWISKDNNLKGYLTDSTGKGNYYEDENTNAWKGTYTETGKIQDYSVKNIYDMAGNVWEWTMESYNTFNRVGRGGFYGRDGAYGPVSYRNYGYPSDSSDSIGFRVALFL